MNREISYKSFVFSSPLFGITAFLFLNDAIDWARRLYFPSPFHFKKYTLSEAIQGIAWKSHGLLLLCSVILFSIVVTILSSAKKGKKIAKWLTFLYLYPSVCLLGFIYPRPFSMS